MLIRGDARALPLLDRSVQCVVTSPPYWGLRDYGTARWLGGDPACAHLNGPLASPKSTLQGYTGPDVKLAIGGMPFRDACGKCGAQRIDSQLGLEATPDAYVQSLVQVFAEVWRVLKDDGTVWLNLGDSYGTGGSGQNFDPACGATNRGGQGVAGSFGHRKTPALRGFHKQLVGIPWRVAFALQADGWYLRSDIIWSKPNPMPESVTDRPTKAHEYIFLLSKSERYYYDAAAIAESVSTSMLAKVEQGYEGLGLKDYAAAGVQNPSSVKARIIANARRKAEAVGMNGRNAQAVNSEAERRDQPGTFNNNPNLRPNLTRNKRTVWHVATQPYSGSHFATFPEALIEPCILAGSRVGDIVLDPFVGSGTVGTVCTRLMRRWVGVDLAYQHLSAKRTEQLSLVEMLPFDGGNDDA